MPASDRGFSLIEVLVALLVLSVGLLTVAAMQVAGLRAESRALNGTRATLLAADIIDRIRANPAGAEFYALAIDAAPPAPPKPCADAGGVSVTDACTAEEMALHDLAVWREAMAAGSALAIPGASGAVEFLPGPPDVHRITVRWRERGEEATYTLDIAGS